MGKRFSWICYFLIFAILFSMSGNIDGQESYATKTFTTNNGLPHNHIFDITQDKTGFIWIGTWDGLARFDGYEFKNYYHDPEDSTSIPYMQVLKVVVDRFNNLWVLTLRNSLVLFNREKNSFLRFKNLKTNTPQDIAIDKDGELWSFNNTDGLLKYDYKSRNFIHFVLQDEQAKDVFFGKDTPVFLAFDNMGKLHLFVKYEERIAVFSGELTSKKSMKISRLPTINKPASSFPGFAGTEIFFRPYLAPSGDFYLFSNAGIFKNDQLTHSFIQVNGVLPLSNFQNQPNFSWSYHDHIINLFQPGNRMLSQIEATMNQYIQAIFVDNLKNVWYSSVKGSGEGDGLQLSVPIPKFFKHYLLEYDKTGNTNAYFAVLKDRFGDIWAAPRNLSYIFRIKPNGKVSKCNEIREKKWNAFQHPRSFLEDSIGIWIGYYDDLLMRYDFRSGKFTKEFQSGSSISGSEGIHSFRNLVKNGSKLFYTSEKSICAYAIAKRQVTRQSKNAGNATGYSLVRDGSNGFWVGYSEIGIKHFNDQFKETGSFQICNGIYNIVDLCVGDDDDLWIAMMGGGLAHLYPKTNKTEVFTTANGLSNNTCYNILKDRKGNLWISTNHGISRFNPKTKQFRIFGASDGLKIDEFNSDAAYQAPDGEMFFGGMGGIVSFYPDSLKENGLGSNMAPLVITDLMVSGITRYFKRAIYELDSIKLQRGDNNFQVSFACLDYQNADKINYRYRLSGINNDFVETDYRHRFVNFANLVPGEYLLQLEATNRDGDWVSKTSLLIVIPPFYYQTVWFRLFVILTLVLIVGGFVMMYNRQIRLKAREQQDELRLESLRGQMNPHFIFNSLNSINYFISQSDRLSANRYIADFSRLIRSILGNMSEEYIPFEKELASLNDYLQLEHLRFSDKFDYSLKVDETILIENLKVSPGMVQPFVENAIWHGGRGLESRIGHNVPDGRQA